MEQREGTVSRVLDIGLGYIQDPATGETFVFRFGNIAGYKGERPDELISFSPKGLARDVKVKFWLGSDGNIEKVAPVV